MRLGMVVRDDNGGLGNLTFSAWQNLRPETTVVVQSRPCRGEPHPEFFEEAWTSTVTAGNPITDSEWKQFAELADVWWTAETWYNENAETIIRKAGAKSVLYAMPELFSGSKADSVWNPTSYLQKSMPRGCRVVPWPISPPPIWRKRSQVKTILHVSGGAQFDRNGTLIFLEALKHVKGECKVFLHQPDSLHRINSSFFSKLPSNVKVEQTRDYVDSMQRLYNKTDILVLPRRYAGLCLPAFEAFSNGCLVMMPNVEPQWDWPIVGVDARPQRTTLMKGGKVPLWEVDASILAEHIDRMLSLDSPSVQLFSEKGREWAEENSWDRLGRVWRQELVIS